MSHITDFIGKLAPRIRKSVVQKDLDTILSELRGYTIPMVKDLATQAKVVPFKSEFYKVMSSHLYDRVKMSRKSDNIWLDLTTLLLNVEKNTEELIRLVDKVLQEDTLRDGITASSAHLLRMAGVMSFISAYTMDMADYALTQEAVAIGDSDDTPPAQAKYIVSNMERYASALADCGINPKEFATIFSSIPDVHLSAANASSVSAMFSKKELDPFTNMQNVNQWAGSLIFGARMMWETWMAERFHAAKDRKAMLELRLLHLQNKLANSPNPRLQKEIEGLQSRINKYDRKIREVEASL